MFDNIITKTTQKITRINSIAVVAQKNSHIYNKYINSVVIKNTCDREWRMREAKR